MRYLIAILVFLGIYIQSSECLKVNPFKLSCEEYKNDEIRLLLDQNKYYRAPFATNWYAAYEYCRANNLQLVTLNTEKDYNDLIEYFKYKRMYNNVSPFESKLMLLF